MTGTKTPLRIVPTNRKNSSGKATVSLPTDTPVRSKPKLLDQLREALRSRHYSRRTEQTYCHWVKKFIFFHNVRHPAETAEPEMNQFPGTSKVRPKQALLRIKEWCKANRHRPIGEQQHALTLKLRGHYGYYGITGNSKGIAKFGREVGKIWCKWLSRRSQKARLDWETFNRLLMRYPLPPPIVIHSIYRRAANP